MQTLLAFHGVLDTHPKAQLTFIGEGPLRPQLEAYIRDNRLESSVTLTGAMEQQEALNHLQQHHIFCQHSVTGMDGDQEGFALSPAEAALFEMPVIATWHNGIPEHVSHEQTGLLVREWDIPAMTQAMHLLASDSGMRATLGAAGRNRILALCDPSKRKAELSTILESAMG
jgi:glycosyltransferase involved in cell wall biosynthesis